MPALEVSGGSHRSTIPSLNAAGHRRPSPYAVANVILSCTSPDGGNVVSP